MMNEVVIHTLEELQAFLNANGVEENIMEIALRNNDKRFKPFTKVVLDNAQSGQEKQLAEKVIQALNENNLLNEKNMKRLGHVAHIEKLGLLLNGLNLCATCAGFAVMYAMLDKMSTEINQQIEKLRKDVRNAHDVGSAFEFNKVLAEHTDMLDCERKQQPYSEEKMRKLVDGEYNVLQLLIMSYQKEVSGDHDALIFSIFSLLAMFTVSLRKFDELYYFNNHQVIGEDNPWHLAHDKWTGIYDMLLRKWFIEKLQDYGTFEAELTTIQTDAYYSTLTEQVSDLKEEITDNQALILAFGDKDTYRQYRQLSAQQIADTVKAAFREVGAGLDESMVSAAFHHAMQQAAMA